MSSNHRSQEAQIPYPLPQSGQVRDPSLGEKEINAFNHISESLTNAGLTEQDVWEANPAVGPVLSRNPNEVEILLSLSKVCLLSVNFTLCPRLSKLGLTTRVYSVDVEKPVSYIIALIFKKLELNMNSRLYTLSSTSGNILGDTSLLKNYGFGSLMSNWQLAIVEKTEEQISNEIHFQRQDPATYDSSYKDPIVQDTTMLYLVTFLLPDDPAFLGALQITRKVHPSTPISHFISLLCSRYRISNPMNWCLTSLTGLVLSHDKTLAYYGLGKFFKSTTLKVIYRTSSTNISSSKSAEWEKAKPSDVDHISGEFAWTHLDPQFTLEQALAVIRQLDKQCLICNDRRRLDMNQFEREKQTLSICLNEKTDQYTELSTQFERLGEQAKKLLDSYLELKKSRHTLSKEKGELEISFQDTKKQLSTVSSELETQNTALEALQNEYSIKKSEFERRDAKNEAKIAQLDKDFQEENLKTMELYSQKIIAQEELNKLDALLAKATSEKANLSTKLEKALEHNNTLMQDVNQMSCEKSIFLYNEQQLTDKYNTLHEEYEKRKANLATIRKEKIQCEQEYQAYKVETINELQLKDNRLVTLEQSLENHIREHEEMVTTHAQQIRGLSSSLETTITSRSGLEQINLQLKEKLVQQIAEFDQLKTTHKTVTQNLNAMQTELKNVQEVLTESKSKLNDANIDISAKALELDRLKYLEVELTKEQHQLQQELSGLQVLGTKNQVKQRELENEVDKLKKEVAKSTDELRTLHEENANLIKQKQASMSTMKTAMDELNAKLTKSYSEKGELEASYRALEQKQQELTIALKSLKDEKNKMEQFLETQRSQLVKAQNQNESKVTELNHRIEVLQQEYKAKLSKSQHLFNVTEESYKNQITQLKEQFETATQQHRRDKRAQTSIPIKGDSAYDASLAKQIDSKEENVSMPPPPPPLPPFFVNKDVSVSMSGLSLEEQILTMKDTLAKIDQSIIPKAKTHNQNFMASMLISGLEKRFKLARGNDAIEYEDLVSPDLCINYENEEMWAN